MNSAPARSAEKVKVAVVASVDVSGPVRIVATGAVADPLNQEYSAGDRSTTGPTVPTVRVARTSSSWSC